MKNSMLAISLLAALGACASITNDPTVPIALSFSNNSPGSCRLTNKRAAYQATLPATVQVRRSDDPLRYDCTTESGAKAFGDIPSTIGTKLLASAVFLDFGITDSITDKHREYPASFVIPIAP